MYGGESQMFTERVSKRGITGVLLIKLSFLRLSP